MLTSEEIWAELNSGRLVFDPLPSRSEVADNSLPIRIGHEFLELPDPEFGPGRRVIIPLDGHVTLHPHKALLAVGLANIVMPAHLHGMITGRSSWGRLGVIVSGPSIMPSFRGKLRLEVLNVGTSVVQIAPTAGIATIRLFRQAAITDLSGQEAGHRLAAPEDALAQPLDPVLVPSWMTGAEVRPPDAIGEMVDRALSVGGAQKGKSLEQLVASLISEEPDLKLVQVNARLSAEEIDVLVLNESASGFYRYAGSPILIECKNWEGKIGASQISIVLDKLRTLSPDAKTAVLVTRKGVTGTSRRDALLKIREARRDGRYVLVIEASDLRRLSKEFRFSMLLEEKYSELFLY